MANLNYSRKIDAVILAGGKSRRLKGLIGNHCKPMVKIYKNIRFLDYLLNYICKFDLNKIYIIAGYKGNEIYKKYNNTNINLIPIECIIEKKPLGTGGALSLIKNKISQKFLVFNGDSIFNLDLNKIINHNLNKKKKFPSNYK